MSPTLGSGTIGEAPSPWTVTVRTQDGRVTLRGLSGPDPAEVVGGRGGWEEVQRNRRTPVTQWVGAGLATTTVVLWLSRWAEQASIESDLALIDGLAPLDPTTEPPALLVQGAPGVPSTMRWVAQSVAVSERLRLPDGATARAQVTFELLEYRPGDVVVVRQSATKRSEVRNSTPAKGKPKTYTVRKGDTLSAVAARLLGKSSRWTELAKLNGLRNPNNLKAGQVLKLPSS